MSDIVCLHLRDERRDFGNDLEADKDQTLY